MDKDFLIQLTNSVYRLTLLFPKKEPLRYKMRGVANDVLASSLRNNPSAKEGEGFFQKIQKDLEVLDGFFEVALVQNWVSPSEILAIKEKYDSLKRVSEKLETKTLAAIPVKKIIAADEKVAVNETVLKNELNHRQEKIIDFLKENGRAQVWQIKRIMPDITKRTLRRDFEYMLNQELIERIGERNDTFYQIKTIEA